FAWADVEFFVLDNRYHRSPTTAPRTEAKTQLGEAQRQWLIDALTSSYAPFKVVVLGGQFVNGVDLYEGYARYPNEQQRILDALVERGIDGVVFLTGDRHHTELLRLDVDGFYPLYDFTNSPLTSGAASAERERVNVLRVPGTLVVEQRNFGTLTFSGPRTDRVLTMRTYAADGTLLWEHAVRASELRAPERG
ncbi:MAG: alkaline phosphatase D family protein, partial [Rhodothermales bacterium]|nr:alkaline phosphatase D family protein [Rhodothermales bacterium]